MYVHRIDIARKVVALATAIFGVGAIVCIHQDEHWTGALRFAPGMWRWCAWVFAGGVCASVTAAFALVVEHLARPSTLSPFAVRPFLARALVIGAGVAGVVALIAIGFGFVAGVIAAIGLLCLLAAGRQRGANRCALAVLAVLALALTLWAAQVKPQPEKGAHPTTASRLCPSHAIQDS
jgi:hypothetical protein